MKAVNIVLLSNISYKRDGVDGFGQIPCYIPHCYLAYNISYIISSSTYVNDGFQSEIDDPNNYIEILSPDRVFTILNFIFFRIMTVFKRNSVYSVASTASLCMVRRASLELIWAFFCFISFLRLFPSPLGGCRHQGHIQNGSTGYSLVRCPVQEHCPTGCCGGEYVRVI